MDINYSNAPPGLYPLIRITIISLLLFLPVTLFLILIARFATLLPPRPPARPRERGSPAHLLIVLGSGGHTTEMFLLLQHLDLSSYNRRTWVVGEGDSFSAARVKSWEEKRRREKEVEMSRYDDPSLGMGLEDPAALERELGVWDIRVVPRARKIHQSLWTTPLSAWKCFQAAYSILQIPHPELLKKIRNGDVPTHVTRENSPFPDLIITNGPGTGVVVILASYALRWWDTGYCESHGKMRTMYVESWARVKRLSLSGKILRYLVDRFLVQWEQLKDVVGSKAEFIGVLVAGDVGEESERKVPIEFTS